MPFEIIKPVEAGESDPEDVAFRRALELSHCQLREANPWRRYWLLRELGYTPEGAGWVVEQDATEAAVGDPPPPSLPDAVAAFVPGEILTIAEAALASRDRQPLRGAATIGEIEHWLGKPYASELPPEMAYTYRELNPPETEAERARRLVWEFAQELLCAIARGELQTVPQRHAPRNRYAQTLKLDDVLRAAQARGGYGEVFAALLAQRPNHVVARLAEHEQQEDSAPPPGAERAAPAVPEEKEPQPLRGSALRTAQETEVRNTWGVDLDRLPNREQLYRHLKATPGLERTTHTDAKSLRRDWATPKSKKGGAGMHRTINLDK
jgi:hypothetical protein